MAERILAVGTDLIFATKIRSTAAAVGADAEWIRTLPALESALAAGPAARVLIDMNAEGMDPIAAIGAALRSAGPPRVVAYLSHVQTDLAAAARAAGAHDVMARSTFSKDLPTILKGAPSHGTGTHRPS